MEVLTEITTLATWNDLSRSQQAVLANILEPISSFCRTSDSLVRARLINGADGELTSAGQGIVDEAIARGEIRVTPGGHERLEY